MAPDALFVDLLRSQDEAKAVLEVVLITRDDDASPSTDTRNRRVLGIVSHKEDWDLTEEGGLFICKYKDTKGEPPELEVQRVFPIYGRFAIEMSEVRSNVLDLRAGHSPKSVLEQPRASLKLTITPAQGHSAETQPVTFITHDLHGLKNLIVEAKRLIDASDVEANAVINLAQSTTHFSWLRHYFSQRITVSTLTTLPQDLRTATKPLLERLSSASAGLTGDDHSDINTIRQDWILTQARNASRWNRRRLKIRVGTFNVNGKLPSQDLSDWVQGRTNAQPNGPPVIPSIKNASPLSLGEHARNPFDWLKRPPSTNSVAQVEDEPKRLDANSDDPDVFALGFQELDLSTEALLYSSNTIREDAWTVAILAALGEKAVKYEKLASKQLVGMLIIIFVKKSLKPCFTDIKTTAAGAGILGVMGNKGGTAVRLTFTPPPDPNIRDQGHLVGSTTLTFVNAHLAAFDEMVEKRNSDFIDLSKRLTFKHIIDPVEATEEASEYAGAGVLSTHLLNVYETDTLFWMLPDLNYRLDVPDLDLRRMLKDDEWDDADKFNTLLAFDQLRRAAASKKAFEGFFESPITHFPTYRFSPGLGMDKLGYDLKRKPAWTDRILFMYGSACQVQQTTYTGHHKTTMSDHRPVAADYNVDIDYYDANEYRSHVASLFRELEDLDDDTAQKKASLKVTNASIDFGKVYYEKVAEKKITVSNTGSTPCAFRFVPIQHDAPIHPDWLEITPTTGVLLAEEEIEITFRALVNQDNAVTLNASPKDLDSTLILHTLLGKDHFISVTGEYQYTCFANPLSRLTRFRSPARAMKRPDELLPETKAINAPREITRVVNWLMAGGADVDALFLIPADEAKVDAIRECLDTGNEFPWSPTKHDTDVAIAFGAALIGFIESLPESIIPPSLHAKCPDLTGRDEAFELLDGLPSASVNVWMMVTAFLHFICARKEGRAEKIAVVLAPVLLRNDRTLKTLPISPREKEKFLLHFIR